MALTLRGTTMQYNLNLKNIKQSATNLGKFLKDYNIPRNVLLEAIAKVFFFKNYNTLEGLATKPHIIEHLPIQKRYLFEIEAEIEKPLMIKLLNESFLEAKGQFNLINLLSEKVNEKTNYFHIELDLSKSDQNILTAMFLLCEKIKNMNVDISKFDYCRVVCEKESFMSYFNHSYPKPKKEDKNLTNYYKNLSIYDHDAEDTERMIKTLQATPTKEALEFYESLNTKAKSSENASKTTKKN